MLQRLSGAPGSGILSVSPLPVSCDWPVVVREPWALERHREIARSDVQLSRVRAAADLARGMRSREFARSEIREGIYKYLAQFETPPESLASLDKITDPNCAIVITGQQPGFLGGPIYTFLKAAHAIVLAKAVESQSGNPVVPFFWNHSDDHDLDETRGIAYIDGSGEPLRLTVDLGRGRPFLSDVTIPESVTEVFDRFRQLLPFGPDKGRVEELFEPKPGANFARETSRILLNLFGRHGLVVFEPLAIRGVLSRALAGIVPNTIDGLHRLAAVAREIRSRNFNPPFDEKDPSLLFVRTANGRERVRFDGEMFIFPDGAKSRPDELAALISRRPEDYTSGVATRLVTELLSLPVAASIRGPAELAYSPCSLAFLPPQDAARAPIEFPRFSASILDVKSAAIFESLTLSAAEILSPMAEETKAAREITILETELYNIQSEFAARLDRLDSHVRSVDGNLARPFDKTRQSIAASMDTFRSKLGRALDDKTNISNVQLRRLRASVFPFGKPQERSFSIAPFLCGGLTQSIDQLLNSIDPLPAGHRFLYLTK
ncbi:MAG: bacillithiol biosynthesis BshC [Planctomycetes bacterium]|nr:bacillithiol biosynthesis BshC [Planctomycetota bacterium]